jgi:putative membrane protein
MRVAAFAAAVSLAALAACSPHSDRNADSNVMLANDSLMANDLSVDEGDMNAVADNGAAALPTDAATFIATAAASDLFETQSSQLALGKSKNKDVRDFAQMMITDHARTTQSVKDAAAKAKLTVPPPVLSADQQQMMAALQPLTGDDFDRTYLQQQVPAHQQALALMQNYAESGDTPALQDAARTAIPIVQKHLARLRELTRQSG